MPETSAVRTPQVPVRLLGTPALPDIVIRPFAPGDEAAFRDINLEWIERYFAVEQKDRDVLNNPQHYILDPGGAILIAVDGGAPVGVVALMTMDGGSVELAKMGVKPEAQGRG